MQLIVDQEVSDYVRRVQETIGLLLRPERSMLSFNLQRVGLLAGAILMLLLALALASTSVPYVAVIPLTTGLTMFHPKLLVRGYSRYQQDWVFANSDDLMIELQREAQLLLGRGEDAAAVGLLKESLLPLKGGADAVVDSCRRIGGDAARDELIRLAMKGTTPGLRANATCALGSNTFDPRLDVLRRLLADREMSVRMSAIDALFALNMPEARRILDTGITELGVIDRWYYKHRRRSLATAQPAGQGSPTPGGDS